jgi:DNA-binding MarR family transcriptional regulator
VPRPSLKRAGLMAAMERETRALSTLNIRISQAVAARLGINSSDFECLDRVRKAPDGAITAGALAAATGLTSGAITGVLDRLERAGLVRRARDPADRRKVIVHVMPRVEKTVPNLFEPMHRAMVAMWSSYSDAELELILRFLTRVGQVMRAKQAAIGKRGRHAPRRGRTRAKPGSSDLAVS